MLNPGRFLIGAATLAALSITGAALAAPAKPPKAPRTPTATAPTPAPAPAPTPTAVESPLKAPLAVQSLPAYQITVKHEYAASGPNAGKPQFQGNMARVTSTVKYDPATQTYTVRDTGSTSITSSFGGTPASSTEDFNTYNKSANGTTETFKVSNVGATLAGVTLSYAQYAHWRRVKPGGGNFGNTAQNDTYFAFGPKTTPMPTVGTATYNTYLDGTYINKDRSYDVDGTGTLTANFGTASGTLTFSAAMTGTPTSGSGIDFGTLAGSGTITSKSSSFSGSGSNSSGYAMNMAGYFFGPGAAELGGVFQLKGPNGGNGDGAIVGGKP